MFFFFENRELFRPGRVCRIKGNEEKKVVIHKVDSFPGSIYCWCYENKPVRYRMNRKGDNVIDFDPACFLSPYSFDQLIITDEIPLQDGGWGSKYRHDRSWRL